MNHDDLTLNDPDENIVLLNEGLDVYNCRYCSIDTFKILKENFNHKGLSVVCFNIRSFDKNADEFLGYLESCEHDFDIIILTETWAKDETHTLCHITGYESVHNFRLNRRGGGVSIFVKEKYRFNAIENSNISTDSIESVAITLSYPNSDKKINVLGLYRPPKGDSNLFIDRLSDIINQNDLSSKDTIITGDFNICLLNEDHSTITANFMNMMSAFFFRPLITRPTRFGDNIATVIDHIWVNTPTKVESYIFYCDITDHCPVFCRIGIPVENSNELVEVKFRNLSIANKQKYNNMLNNTNWNLLLNGITDTNELVAKLTSVIDKYYDMCFPVMTKFVGLKRLSKPWITKALHKSIKKKHYLFKLARQNRIDLNAYKRYSNILSTLIKTSKVSYYKNQFDTSKKDLRKTWSIINSTINPSRKRLSIHKLQHNNEIITDPTKMAEVLNAHFAGIGLKLKDALPKRNENSYFKHLPPSLSSSIYLSPSTPAEIVSIIKDLKNTKSTFNSLSTKVLKENSLSLSNPISLIFNNIITQSQYPDTLKIACITALFKAGDELDPNNYRPISSLTTLNKIFEKLLHKRLNSFFETNNVYSDNQYGFRKGMSTCDAVNELLNSIYTSMNDKKYFGAVFLDLSKAFDTVPHNILLKKLEHYGIRDNALKLMRSYLSNRKQFVSINGHKSEKLDVKIGVPQGSVLGPLLFLIYINDLPNSMSTVKSILFADDTTIFSSHENIHTLCRDISADLHLVNEWLIDNSLTLNVSKTYYTIFSMRKVPDNICITIGQRVLDRKSNGKFLGVVLDEKLTFKEHIKIVSKKVSKLTGLMYKLKHFFPLDVLKNLYFTLIQPYFTYCILAWGAVHKATLQPLVLHQKKLIRILTNSDYYAHTNTLFKQLKILNLENLYVFHTLLYMYKALVMNRYPDVKNSILSIQANHVHATRINHLRMPYCRVDRCKQMIVYQSIKHWNSLPVNIKEKMNFYSFKKECKAYVSVN